MRVLTSCPGCRRQYDCAGRAPGQLFHCACGDVLRVPAVNKAAKVQRALRCSSCGAPRQGELDTCTFCSASLALDEGAATSTCPLCATPMRDDARYCHRCTAAITAPMGVGAPSRFSCPVCTTSSTLVQRTLGDSGVALLECGRCAGLWLGQAAFGTLGDFARGGTLPALVAGDERAAAQAPPTTRAASGRSRSPTVKQPGAFYRKCVECGSVMQRLDYARKSGVIIDVCQRHGVWFDADELARVLLFIKAGGLADAEARQGEQERVDRLARADVLRAEQGRMGMHADKATAPSGSPFDQIARGAGELLLGIVGVLRGRSGE